MAYGEGGYGEGAYGEGGSSVILGTARWTMYDPSADVTWVMPRNPNKMTSPHPPKNTVLFARSVGYSGHETSGVARALQFRQQPYDWSFSGRIVTETHYEDFLTWIRKTNRLQVTDHFERIWEVRIDDVELDEQRPSAHTSCRFEYTIKTKIYRRVTS